MYNAIKLFWGTIYARKGKHTMPRKEDLRYLRTNKKLYETFYSLLKEMVVDDMTVTVVCDAAKLNRATFYKHFNDRFEFIEFCIAQKIRRSRYEKNGLETPVQESIYEDSMNEMFDLLRLIQTTNPDNLLDGTPSLLIIFKSLTKFYYAEYKAYVESVHEQGVQFAEDEEVIASARTGSISFMVFDYMKLKSPLEPDDDHRVSHNVAMDIKAIRYLLEEIKN